MKLFVAKLPPNVTSERLKAMFETYGEVVDAKVIMDRETGMSKCYGFVDMGTESAAQAAIAGLNGLEMDGKEVLVKESDPAPRSNDRPRGPRPGGRPPFNSGGGDRRAGGGPRPDRWGSGGGGGGDRDRGGNRYQDNDRPRRRYDDDFDDKPRRKRI